MQNPPVSVVDTVLTRRNFLGLAAGSAAALAFYAGEISRHEIETIHRSISLSGLPDAFAGMRVVQISDFHFELYDREIFLEAIVRRVNALTPDMVRADPGDFVSKGTAPRRLAITRSYQCAEVLSRLTCLLRYAILGNHDIIADAGAVTDALVTHGIPVLANSYVPLERNGRRLWLAGIKDALEQRPDLAAALPKRRGNEPLILMAHEPDFADFAGPQDLPLSSPDTHMEARFVSRFCRRSCSPRWEHGTCTGSSRCATECSLTSIVASGQ